MTRKKPRKPREWWVTVWPDGPTNELFDTRMQAQRELELCGYEGGEVIKVREVLPKARKK